MCNKKGKADHYPFLLWSAIDVNFAYNLHLSVSKSKKIKIGTLLKVRSLNKCLPTLVFYDVYAAFPLSYFILYTLPPLLRHAELWRVYCIYIKMKESYNIDWITFIYCQSTMVAMPSIISI